MKTVIGFVCGIASVTLSIIVFCGGFVCGYQFHRAGKIEKKTDPADTYADWLKQCAAKTTAKEV
jgi:hypothetical protein